MDSHKINWKRLGFWALPMFGAIALLLNACSTTERSVVHAPAIEGATFVGDKACLDCHGRISQTFPMSAHGRLSVDRANFAGQSGCESCHGPGSKHVAVGGSGLEKFIVNPGRNPQACYECHMDINAEFHLPHHHPVAEAKMNCVQCHDPHRRDVMRPAKSPALARVNGTCAECHREQTRPFVFEHAAMREGCVTCHNPHGSVNPKLLTVRDSNLCLRCHAQVGNAPGTLYIGNVDHTGYVRYGTCWTSGCHSAIHGSNTQPYYFY
jgi:predicted CXXCH cytochrome family protein